MEIKFENVDFSYKKVNYLEKEILKNVNIKFKKGKINGIVGKSGSGKSTLVELINALLLPTNGKVYIDEFVVGNKNLDINRLRFNVGLVMQQPEDNFFNRTVKEELEFYMKFYHYRLGELSKRVSNALQMVGLDDTYLLKNPFMLSNGEKRKIALASILVSNPKVLILDEPTIGLGGKSKKEFIRLIRLLKNRYKKTIIIISHDTDFLHEITDYVVVLYDKKIVLDGNKYDVFKDQKTLKKYGVKIPKIMEFSNKVLAKKNINIGYRDDINDLIKDIYRYVK